MASRLLSWSFVAMPLTARKELTMKKKLLRYVAPMALAIGLAGALGAGAAGASTHGKTHHPHHQTVKPKTHHKKNK
jgi:hypothetical protein